MDDLHELREMLTLRLKSLATSFRAGTGAPDKRKMADALELLLKARGAGLLPAVDEMASEFQAFGDDLGFLDANEATEGTKAMVFGRVAKRGGVLDWWILGSAEYHFPPADWQEESEDLRELCAVACDWFAGAIEQRVSESRGEPTLELLQHDVAILRVLDERPGVCQFQSDIAAGARLDRKTVGSRLGILRSAGLVKRPDGTSRGDIITDKGILALRKSAP